MANPGGRLRTATRLLASWTASWGRQPGLLPFTSEPCSSGSGGMTSEPDTVQDEAAPGDLGGNAWDTE
jgi:hypothetical protein